MQCLIRSASDIVGRYQFVIYIELDYYPNIGSYNTGNTIKCRFPVFTLSIPCRRTRIFRSRVYDLLPYVNQYGDGSRSRSAL
jgi:hypothetical protein